MDGLATCGVQAHTVLHAVGHNAVHRTEQTIEKAGYPQMPLCKDEFFIAQRLGLQVLVSLSVVCE